MIDQAHEYETTVEWTAERRGTLSAPARPAVAVGAPPEFGGTDDVWSPEHLCVAAVNACVMLAVLAIAGNSRVMLDSYAATAVGTLQKVDGRGPVITHVIVRPRVTIGSDVDRTRVDRVFKLAEKNCFISNSLNATVTVEPEVTVRQVSPA